MQVIENERVVMVDIDDTLIMHETNGVGIPITCPYSNEQLFVRPNHNMIRIVKEEIARGAYIVFWSGGGHQWAATVLNALMLYAPNSHVMSKPIAYCDDKPAEEWMGRRVYLHADAAYKRLAK